MKFTPNAPPLSPGEARRIVDAGRPAELYQTPPTPEVDWRQELARVGVVAGVAGGVGVFATVTAALLFGAAIETTKFFVWGTFLLALLPFVVHAASIAVDIASRWKLDQARMSSERRSLIETFDTDASGRVDDAEIKAFVDYVRALHRGERTTSNHAQERHGVAGSTWQGYKDWLVKHGYAVPANRRGGVGFELKPSVRATPWRKIEASIRRRLESSGELGNVELPFDDGGPIDTVSTLGRD